MPGPPISFIDGRKAVAEGRRTGPSASADQNFGSHGDHHSPGRSTGQCVLELA
jgi:hypothetical protein